MKILLIILFLTNSLGFAEQTSSEPVKKQTPVEGMVKKTKTIRKIKVEMCHECGKPEADCDCEGEEHKPLVKKK